MESDADSSHEVPQVVEDCDHNFRTMGVDIIGEADYATPIVFYGCEHCPAWIGRELEQQHKLPEEELDGI